MTSSKKPYFDPVSSVVDFPLQERELLDYWYKNYIFKRYLEKNKDSRKRYSFLDGPITANNPMGVHHAWGRTYKDLFQRYKNMQGYKQRFQNGFDCQGLWVEVEVEKALGFNNKKDIEKYGLDKFTNACKERVNFYAKKQTEQSKRLGNFMDWDNSYYTMSEENNLYIWKFLKICHEKGLIFKNKSATTWCPRCETGLSKHEQADSYKDITDKAVYIKFRIKNRPNEYLLVWTTTPWTISANVLLAINPNYKYVKVREGNEIYILARKAADRLGLKKYVHLDAKKLLGLEYESIYDIPVQKGLKHYVIEWEAIDPSEGTGVVHIAPGCGEEDFELGKKYKADILSPLNEVGIFGEGYGGLSGKYANTVSDQVISFLKEENHLYKTEYYTHSYPHCWRCKTKCLFRLEENWFINCQKIKPGLKLTARKAKWIPSFVGKRMQNWLDNMGDWMISRKRYYGLALPFYECKSCKKLIVIGSKEELKKSAVIPQLVDKLPSLHRPWIDKIKIKCDTCQKVVSRIKDVGDCWLDAGVVPFSTLKYFEDKNFWKKWFPADFVCEMIEQVRLWYYSMLVYGYIFEKTIPYKKVLSFVEVRDEKGERMSKTKGNGIPFDEAVEKIGADVMRWMYLRQNPSEYLLFGYKVADETRRKFHLKLWNVYNFFVTYANLDRWGKPLVLVSKVETKKMKMLDRWILGRLGETMYWVTKFLDRYETVGATLEIEKFVDDLSNWYIRRSRDRVGPCVESITDRDNFYECLRLVFANLCRILAPFTPYLADTMYINLMKFPSVHLLDWPTEEQCMLMWGIGFRNKIVIIEKMSKLRNLVEKVHAQRKEKGIPIRQPLQSVKIYNSPKLVFEEEFVQLAKDELNIKEINFLSGKEKIVLDTKITPELEEEAKTRELIRKVQEERKRLKYSLNQKISVTSDWLPGKNELVNQIKKKTLARKLQEGKQFKVQ